MQEQTKTFEITVTRRETVETTEVLHVSARSEEAAQRAYLIDCGELKAEPGEIARELRWVSEEITDTYESQVDKVEVQEILPLLVRP